MGLCPGPRVPPGERRGLRARGAGCPALLAAAALGRGAVEPVASPKSQEDATKSSSFPRTF